MSNTSGNLGAFLDMLAWSEGTSQVPDSDDGYRVLFGGGTFTGYADHPRQLITIRNLTSSAAGRYQLLARYYDAYKKQLNLPDFSPTSQDAIACQQIHEQGATQDIEQGNISSAIDKVSNIWASLPGANYPGQTMRDKNELLTAFTNAGGSLAGTSQWTKPFSTLWSRLLGR